MTSLILLLLCLGSVQTAVPKVLYDDHKVICYDVCLTMFFVCIRTEHCGKPWPLSIPRKCEEDRKECTVACDNDFVDMNM
ncbi:hypothetical protein LSAT2_005550 [Lamellibrachia satsuma]|nr:hypothetical protein LSAT2_005550 [Lamellibrachia satsuma]